MTSKELEKLQLINKFLNPEIVDFKTLKSINDVIKLPISSFKFLTESDKEIIKELLGVSKIGEITKLDRQQPFKKIGRSKQKKEKLSEILEKDPDLEERIKQAITIGVIIQKIKQESTESSKKDQKIIVVGLNNAGKTAILSKFGGRLGIKDLALLKPTRGVNRQEIKSKDLNLHIWDFGGQIDHRAEYLNEPEKYFFGIDLIIYVIDIQDPQRYEESIEYFEKILNAIIKLEENPHILIFIHKYDPDMRENDEILLNIELLKNLIKNLFKNIKINYDIYITSIYSMISNEPEFSKYIKEVMNDSANLTDPTQMKITELGIMIEKSLNAVIQLSSVMMALEKRVEELETSKKRSTSKQSFLNELPSPEYSNIPLHPPPAPPPIKGPPPSPKLEEQGAKKAIMTELRDIFVKKGIYRKYDF
jgi:small GTP-binding protein